MNSPITIMYYIENKIHSMLVDAKHRELWKKSSIPFSQESCFATDCFLWRFSCPLSTSVCLSLKWRDHGRPLWKGLRIETMVQENKIGYQREWTDDAARWICSLYSRSWEQLLLSLKVIAHIPTGMWWWWHVENLLSLSRAGPTLF